MISEEYTAVWRLVGVRDVSTSRQAGIVHERTFVSTPKVAFDGELPAKDEGEFVEQSDRAGPWLFTADTPKPR